MMWNLTENQKSLYEMAVLGKKKDAIYLHLTQCNQLHGSHEFSSYFFFPPNYFAG